MFVDIIEEVGAVKPPPSWLVGILCLPFLVPNLKELAAAVEVISLDPFPFDPLLNGLLGYFRETLSENVNHVALILSRSIEVVLLVFVATSLGDEVEVEPKEVVEFAPLQNSKLRMSVSVVIFIVTKF